MSAGASRDRDEELLLARISEAAGREHLGRRRATYPAAPFTAGAPAGPGAAIRAVWRAAAASVRRSWRAGGGRGRSAGTRLDFYEHGMTAAVRGRIHVFRYDTTSVRRPGGPSPHYTLIDAGGERVVLRGEDFGPPEAWGPEIRRAVARAQVPRALAALSQGARLTFGPLWVTGDEIGSARTSVRWPRIERIEVRDDSVALRVAGHRRVLATVPSGIPNAVVLQALAEHLADLP